MISHEPDCDASYRSTLLAKIFTAWMLYVSVEKKEVCNYVYKYVHGYIHN